MTQLLRKLLVNMHLKCLGTRRRVDVLLGILMLFVSFQGLLGGSTRPTRSFTRCETITGMDDVNGNSYYATYSDHNYGPIFGGGHEIYIADNAGYNYNSAFYCGCHTYTSPYSYCSCNMWTGSNNFCPDELEVFYEVLA